jgi:1-acyl-sn-glycerol-3-phosphate acyltransferase
MQPELATLTPFERFAFRTVRFWNSGKGEPAARVWQRFVLVPLVGLLMHGRLRVHGLERLRDVPRDAPVLLVSNHRTFFDLFVLAQVLLTRWPRAVSFPVRSNFFYDNPLGVAISLLMSGASMFPPFFRATEKKPFNRVSLQVLIDKLKKPGEMVGFHPEGTRSKTDDPYTLLPAQPGAGELALKARPVVIPAFVNGMTNSVWAELKATLRGERPVNLVYGAPVDLGDWPPETRLSHHKRCADLLAAKIAELGAEERSLRNGAAAQAG